MTHCPKCRLSPCRCVIADGESIKVSLMMADAAARGGDDPNGQAAYEKRIGEGWKVDPGSIGFQPQVPPGLTSQAAYERRISEAWKASASAWPIQYS